MSLLWKTSFQHVLQPCNVVAFTSKLTPEYIAGTLNPVMARVAHLPITFVQLNRDMDHASNSIIAKAVGSSRRVFPASSTDLMQVLLSTFPSLVAAYTFIPLPLPGPVPALRTWDDVKCVREAFPDVHTVLFVPALAAPLARGGKPLERKSWASAAELADAVCTFVSQLDSLKDKVLILPSDGAPIPSISSLNMVTGQSFAYGDVMGDAHPVPAPGSPQDACIRAGFCALYQQLPADVLYTHLKTIIDNGFAAGNLDPTPFVDFAPTDFGCVQAITHLLRTPSVLTLPPDATSSAEFTCTGSSSSSFPGVVKVRNAAVNEPTVSLHFATQPDAPLAKLVSLCSQGPAFVDVYQALWGPARVAAAAAASTSAEWTVYGRYATNPCPYTVSAVECLIRNGQKVKVVEVPNAKDASIPSTKPEVHITVPVVFQKCGQQQKYIGGCKEVKAIFP